MSKTKTKTKKPSKTRLVKQEPQKQKRGEQWHPDDIGVRMMRKREKILNELHQEHFVEKYCKTLWEFPNMYEYEEAVSFVWLDICSIHPKRLCEWYTQGGLYKVQQIVSGIIQREIKSQNSPYHYRVRKKKGVEVPISHLSDYTRRGM